MLKPPYGPADMVSEGMRLAAPDVCFLQGVHLKNKGDLPKEAVEPVATIGMPSKLLADDLVVCTLSRMGVSPFS